MDKTITKGTAGSSIIVRDQVEALVPSHPKVVAIAATFGWRPETVLVRIERALPSPLEQRLYLEIAADCHILPESVAKIFSYIRGNRLLCESDLVDSRIGKNLVSNRALDVAEFLERCLEVMSRADESKPTSMSIDTAALLVLAYEEHAVEIVESIQVQLPEIKSRLHMEEFNDGKALAIVLHKLTHEILDRRPAPTDFLAMLEEEDEMARETLRDLLENGGDVSVDEYEEE